MADPVLGYGVAIEMWDGVSYKPVLCGETCEFIRSVETVETTNPTSGLFKHYMKRRESWTGSVAGLTKIENDAALTFFYMLQTSVRNQVHPLRFVFTDPDGDTKQITGNVIIADETITGTAGDFARASIQFIGTGEFNIAEIDPPPPVEYEILSDYWTVTAGLDYVDLAVASAIHGYNISAGYLLLQVDVEGTQFEIVTSSPGNRECRLNGSFVLNFQTGTSWIGTERVYVLFKRPV